MQHGDALAGTAVQRTRKLQRHAASTWRQVRGGQPGWGPHPSAGGAAAAAPFSGLSGERLRFLEPSSGSRSLQRRRPAEPAAGDSSRGQASCLPALKARSGQRLKRLWAMRPSPKGGRPAVSGWLRRGPDQTRHSRPLLTPTQGLDSPDGQPPARVARQQGTQAVAAVPGSLARPAASILRLACRPRQHRQAHASWRVPALAGGQADLADGRAGGGGSGMSLCRSRCSRSLSSLSRCCSL